jgi:FHA domain
MIDEKSISLEHAIIHDYDDFIRIEDMSKNGITIVRNGVKRKLKKRIIEKLQSDDILFFGFYDHSFMAIELFEEIKKLRLPIGSQRIRCPIHGVVFIQGQQCPECPD